MVIRGFHKFKNLDFLYCKYCHCVLQPVTQNRSINQFELKSCIKCQPLKIKETCLEKYGVDNFQKTSLWKVAVENTCLEKYGDRWVTKVNQIKDKIKLTNLFKYGEHTPQKNNEIKEKAKNTCIEKYGGNQPSHQKEVLQKIRETNLKRYDHPRGPNSDQNLQRDVLSFVKFCISDITENYTIGTKDIDIYIPSLKLGIEVNGDYWHSQKRKDKGYHLNKTNLCESKGIRLIHIWESECSSNKEFIQTLLTLYLENKVYQNEFQTLLEPFKGRLPRDYFQTLDFSGKIEEPVLEKSGNFDVYKTGNILMG